MTVTTNQAPGELELVRAFVNTRDLDEGTDSLLDARGLTAWLVERGLLAHEYAGEPTEADRSRAVALREGFRALLLANNDGRPADPAAIETLDHAARRARISLRVEAGGKARLEAQAAGVDGALGRLLLIAYQAMQRGDWTRLKACRNDTCQWAFFDTSKNRSKTWCLMEVCGSQVKARRYRQRKRAAEAGRHSRPAVNDLR